MSHHAWVATRKGLFELEYQNGIWRIVNHSFMGDPVTMMLHDKRDGSDYAALNLGHFGVKLHKRSQGQKDWTEITCPAYPEQAPEATQGPAWKLNLIWSLAAGSDQQPGRLWAGTIPGGLFRSEDFGGSWQLERSLWDLPQRIEWFGGGYDAPGIHSICVDPRDGRRVLLGISCGGVWLTEDDGANWALSARGLSATYMPPDRSDDENIQDPHRIVQCAADPDHYWCQHHNGIWHSTDGGRNWLRLEPAKLGLPDVPDFGFAVAVDPNDGRNAWFVPAQADQRRIPVGGALAVTRTRDGGQTFESHGSGLPQQDCYDLIYRHGLAVDASGKNLLMVSTTGGLWASHDAGLSWNLALAHLPPAYAVQFR